MSDSPCRSGWERRTLTSLAQYLNGRAFREDEWGQDGLPIVRIEQINDPSAIGDRYDGPVLSQHLIDDGDLVFSWSATLKVVVWNTGPAALNQHLFKVVPHADVDLQFLKQLLDMNMDKLAASSQGSTMKHVTRSALERHRLCVPASRGDQERIAKILSTVDEAVEQTEKLIAKHQQIKAGLMHDLFTRGLTPDGHFRPPHSECPGLYKDSPLGPIPTEWAVTSFEGLLKRGSLKGIQDGNHGELHPKASDFTPDGIPFLMANDLADGIIDFGKCARIPRELYESLRVGFATEGDVLLSHKGTVGETAIVPSGWREVMLTPQLTYYRVTADAELRSRFLYFFFQSQGFQRRLSNLSRQTTRSYVGIGAQKQLQCLVPPEQEQARIESQLLQAEELLRCEQSIELKLRDAKRGLMRDLLTGEVPVPIPEGADHG